MVTSVIQIVKSPADLDKLSDLIRGVVGQLCWGPRLSYGDELVLHIGARLPYNSKKLAGKEKGAWILGTLGTDWQIQNGANIVTASDETPELSSQKIQVIADTTV